MKEKLCSMDNKHTQKHASNPPFPAKKRNNSNKINVFKHYFDRETRADSRSQASPRDSNEWKRPSERAL